MFRKSINAHESHDFACEFECTVTEPAATLNPKYWNKISPNVEGTHETRNHLVTKKTTQPPYNLFLQCYHLCSASYFRTSRDCYSIDTKRSNSSCQQQLLHVYSTILLIRRISLAPKVLRTWNRHLEALRITPIDWTTCKKPQLPILADCFGFC